MYHQHRSSYSLRHCMDVVLYPPPTLYLFLLVLQAFLKFLLFFFKLFNLFSHNKVRIQFFKILQPSKVINTKQSKHFFVTNVVYLFI